MLIWKLQAHLDLDLLLREPQVDLYENGTIAIVEAVSPELGNRVQRVRVQLPGTSPELLQKFREKKIDFAAHANTEDGGAVFLNLLGESAPLCTPAGAACAISNTPSELPSQPHIPCAPHA